MASLMIDAHEGRDVATADVAGAYLNADMKKFTLMRITGVGVEILCAANPSYKKYVTKEGREQVLYLKIVKAIYGLVESALLWYQLFSTSLADLGFEINPYDPCVANCTIDGAQCTIVWYVDDNKISHISPEVVTKIIGAIEEKFGKMTVTRGKEHVFLGMNIRMKEDGTVGVKMTEYLREAIEDSGLDIKRTATTPARKDLFEIDEDSEALPTEEAERFHSVVAKLLYVAIRARMDILLAIIFLCSRVAKCTRQDQAKLKRVLEYLKGTLDLELTLGADDLKTMRAWVDASFAVHEDMKSHTGGVISFGKGALISKSVGQKLNSKSSTEAELIGASDYLPNVIWLKLFMEAQGYNIDNCYLEQDNESAIRLEKNGRASAGSKSRHIDIRYFFVKDRLVTEGITVRHCPTEQMLADFLTKPLQGALFKKFRDVLLGMEHVDSLSRPAESVDEERVGIRVPVKPVETVNHKSHVTWADVAKKGAEADKKDRG